MTPPPKAHTHRACALAVALLLLCVPAAHAARASARHARAARLPGDAAELLRARHRSLPRRTRVLVPVALLAGARRDRQPLAHLRLAARARRGAARADGRPAAVPQ